MISETDPQSLQQRAKKFISANICKEHEYLLWRLKERVAERNANRGNLPELALSGSSIVVLGHTALYLKFAQQYSNPDLYILGLTVGWAPRKEPLFGTACEPQRIDCQGAASTDLRDILWVDNKNLGPFTSAELVEFALDWLTSFYQQHVPN
jgi:hypothetical protein